MVEKITKILARQVLDSRGLPTIEAEVHTKKGFARAIVPSGASTGKHEALELRDKEKAFQGKGVLKAVGNVNKRLAKKLVGKDVLNQKTLDKTMITLDNTPNKSKLGANAILAVSMAAARQAAFVAGKPLYAYLASLSRSKGRTLPLPQMNVINGGRHAGQENDIQEHLILPVGAKNFAQALRICVETYQTLRDLLRKKFGARAILLGDEGGFVPPLKTTAERLSLVQEAIDSTGYARKMAFALDCAASEFYANGVYRIGQKEFNASQLIDFYEDLISEFKVVSLEDGLAEDDWQGWQELTKRLGSKTQLVGDDLLVTNVERIKKAVKLKACNALLLKVNQIGTVTEALEAAKLASKNGWRVVVSHRSGETEDAFIADLVVGLEAGQAKFGASARSERTCKYNQLLRIEEQLSGKALFAQPFK